MTLFATGLISMVSTFNLVAQAMPDFSVFEKGGLTVFAGILLWFVLFRLYKVIETMNKKLDVLIIVLARQGGMSTEDLQKVIAADSGKGII